MQKLAERVFGIDAASFVPALDELSTMLAGFQYRFLPGPEFQRIMLKDVAAGMRIYYLEILHRAHFAAVTSLLRSHRWVRGILSSAQQGNLHTFAASFRGFLEAAADTHHSLNITCTSLADCHSIIRKAIAGKLRDVILAPELEERLIHFTHARRLEKKEVAPDSHKAEAAAKYLATLNESGDGRVLECYGELCELTHPAASSIMCFTQVNDSGTLFTLSPDWASTLIDDFCRDYSDIMLRIMALGVMPPLLQLKVLNHIGPPPLRIPLIEGLPLASRPVWIDLRRRLNDPSPPTSITWQGSK
jgi:hypothetical protein